MKSDTGSPFSLSICHEMTGPDAMVVIFWMLSFKPAFSLSSFTFIKRLFSSSSLSTIKVVSSAYLRLMITVLCLVAQSCPTLWNTVDYSLSGPVSMRFSRQECWNGLPCPPLGDLPNPGIKPRSRIAGGFFTVWLTREALMIAISHK